MNKKLYWKIRKAVLNLTFRFKRIVFKLYNLFDTVKGSVSLWNDILKSTVAVVFKTAFIAFFLYLVELLFAKFNLFIPIDNNILLDAMIGGIGVAGVILGLYCSNISSIYSTKYSDAPKDIAQAFRNDKVTQKCIRILIDYIVFCFLVLSEILLGVALNWPTVIVVVIWSISVIISYSLAGNRPYRLSDIYAVTFDTHRALYKTIHKKLKTKIFSGDINFQSYFQKSTEKQISLLETIQRYASKVEKNNNSSLYEFMAQNIVIVASYWDMKASIGKDSFWYKEKSRYQKWHFANSTEAEIALKTGTPLNLKNEHDYLWFEDRLFDINLSCIKELISKRDYLTICKYIQLQDQICNSAINANELGYYVKHIGLICSHLENAIMANENGEIKETLASIVDELSTVSIRLLMQVRKHYQTFDLEKLEKRIIFAIDSNIPIEHSHMLRGSSNSEYYKKVAFEISTDGKRITPDWVLKQVIANEEYNNLNSFLDAIIDSINTLFSLGKKLSEENKLFEACIILSRFYELESKYTYFKNTITNAYSELERRHLDNNAEWEVSKLKSLDESISSWRMNVPELLSKCSSSFASETWNNRDEYPDFLGECYNRICIDAVESIINNNLPQFQKDYECLTKLMLFYHEYIRADFIKNQNLYRIEYAYYMITFPIIEWAQIGGLAILWGEFFKECQWSDSVNKIISLIIKDNNDEDLRLAEALVDYAQKRDRFFLGVGCRDLIETGWNIKVAQAIEQSKAYETEQFMFGTILKTDSKLLNAFCRDFPHFGFVSNTADVLWVTCINPKLSEEKQYHTISKWEKKLKHD